MLQTMKLRLPSYAKSISLYCSTENKLLFTTRNIESARFFAFKHKIRGHEVIMRDGNGKTINLDLPTLELRCPKCGQMFNDDLTWVTHMTKADCLQQAEPSKSSN